MIIWYPNANSIFFIYSSISAINFGKLKLQLDLAIIFTDFFMRLFTKKKSMIRKFSQTVRRLDQLDAYQRYNKHIF